MQSESSQTIASLISALRDAHAQNTEQTLALQDVAVAMQKLSDRQISMNEWQEMNGILRQVSDQVGSIQGAVSSANAELLSNLQYHIEELTRQLNKYGATDEAQSREIGDLANEIKRTMEVFKTLHQDAVDREERNFNARENKSKRRMDFITKVILALISGGSVLYIFIEKALG